MNSLLTDTSALTIYEDAIFHQQAHFPKELGENAPVNWDLALDELEELPIEFEKIAVKLHKNYLYWQYLSKSEHQTEATFYRYTQAGIKQAFDKVTQSGIPIEERVILIIETRIALATLNALLIAAADYLKAGHLQDSKETVETALSILYELIQNREKLEPSLKKGIETIQQDIINDRDTAQYAASLLRKIDELENSALIQQAKFYVIRQQLEKLRETLILLTQGSKGVKDNMSIDAEKVDDLMCRLLVAMSEEDYITTIKYNNLIKGVKFSQQGKYLAIAVSNNLVTLVEMSTQKIISDLPHEATVIDIIFSPNENYLLTISFDKTVRLIESSTGKIIKIIGHKNPVQTIDFSSDQAYLVTGYMIEYETEVALNTELMLRSIASSKKTKDMRNITMRALNLCLLDVNTGKVIITLTIDMEQKQEVFKLSQSFSNSNELPSYDDKYLAIQYDNKVELCLRFSRSQVITTINHKSTVNEMIFSSDNRYLATSSRENIIIVEIATGKIITNINHDNHVYSISFSRDGNYLVTSSVNKIVQIINILTGNVFISFKLSDEVNYFTSNFDNLNSEHFPYHLIQENKKVSLIETPTDKLIKIFYNKNFIITSGFSPDGNNLIILSDKMIKFVNLQKLLTDIPNLLNEYQKDSTSSSSQTSAIIHLDKPEAFFLYWLHRESNTHSFYEYMLQEAQKEQNGLSVKYASPILDTPLLLDSLGFLLLNAEKHYQTVYPTLSNINDVEIQEIGMQEMKQTLSAALSTLYEFLSHRMELDQEDYCQAIKRFKNEIEDQINHTDSLTQLYQKIQTLLQLDGIQQKNELKTLKDILEKLNLIFSQLLPEEIKPQFTQKPIIAIKKTLTQAEIKDIIKELTPSEIIPFISHLQEYGLLNPILILEMIEQISAKNLLNFYQRLPETMIDSEVAIALIQKIESESIIELCQQLPNAVINKTVAMKAIKKYRKTHYIGTISPLTDLTDKDTLLKILTDAPDKKWWRS